MLTILPLFTAEPEAVETLLDQAFGADRHRRTAYRLREGTAAIPELSFAAFQEDILVGSLQSWPLRLIEESGDDHPLILVGPIAVHPSAQRSGIGRALTRHMLDAADAHGHDALMLIGDPEYYDRHFGFSAAETGDWELPGPVERRRVLARLASDRLDAKRGRLVSAAAPIAALRRAI